MICNEKFNNVVLMTVPTGIGASIGGYAGDASTYAQKIAEHVPLIVNPNVVNAAVFSGINDNMFYVEGWCIEQFVKGNIALIPSKNNKIGVIFDKSIPQNVLNIHINTINAIKTVYGIDIIGYEITQEPAGVEFFNTESGISSGNLKNPETLKQAGQKLLQKGAQALAVVCFFEEPPEDDYESGTGVDIVGGVEAVISHYLSKELMCPCVHAPAFEDVTISGKIVSAKAAAEYITPTFLPCLMFGLKNAPLVKNVKDECIKNNKSGNYITYKNLKAMCMPYNALGSSTVLDSVEKKIPVYAIKENKSVLDINKYSIGKENDIIEIQTYDEFIKNINTEFLYEHNAK